MRAVRPSIEETPRTELEKSARARRRVIKIFSTTTLDIAERLRRFVMMLGAASGVRHSRRALPGARCFASRRLSRLRRGSRAAPDS